MFQFEQFILPAYFFLKNLFITRLYRQKITLQQNVLSSLIIAIVSFLTYSFIHWSYAETLRGGVYVGSIKLPPFWMIFIAADVISDLFLLGKYKHKTKQGILIVLDCIKIVLLGMVFLFMIDSLELPTFSNHQLKTDLCFIATLTHDVVDYYYRNNAFPDSISDATTLEKNPFNQSELHGSIKEGEYLIYDDMENVITAIPQPFSASTPEDFDSLMHPYRLSYASACNK